MKSTKLSPHPRPFDRWRTFVLAGILAVGLVSAGLISGWLGVRQTNTDLDAERLYLTGKMARRISLSFNGLVADWYWMRSLQYVGRKLLSTGHDVTLDNLSSLNLNLLAPLLDNTTTLDPEFIAPYEYASVVLPAINRAEAIRIARKGIAANPRAWRMYQHLGYIYWQEGDFATAGEVYAEGARIPGAPGWMEAMKARMAVEGGSRDTARQIYWRMYEETNDDQVKSMAQKRLEQLNSLDQRDVIRQTLSAYQEKHGRCPVAWRDLEGTWRTLRFEVNAEGIPLDPTGHPYQLVNNGCDVDLDPQSEILTK